MKKISLTQGKFALVDDADHKRLNKWRWQASKDNQTYYATRSIWLPLLKKVICIRMHNCILKKKCAKKRIDHIDGNGLNNQQANLRFATRSQNMANKRVKRNGSSKFKGVCWDKAMGKWKACAQKDHTQFHLGYFIKEKDAAIAYNKAAIKIHGEFARLNKVA